MDKTPDPMAQIEARIRDSASLTDRLLECRRRIGNMCSERRGPRMSIPPEWSDDDMFICKTLEEAGRALAAQPGQGEPGWKLVPCEPTREMFDRGAVANGGRLFDAHLRAYWQAMFHAAPAPPTPTPDEAGVRAAGDWQQYAKDDETAQNVIERERADSAAFVKLYLSDEKNRRNDKLLLGFMLDCNVIGLQGAAENLHRGIKEQAGYRAALLGDKS